MNTQNNIKTLLSILRCPACQAEAGLQIVDRRVDFPIDSPLSDQMIACQQCDALYPITDDHIPIMWSKGLKQAFSKINQSDQANAAETNISANMEIYDDISDNYDNYTRQNANIGKRMSYAVERIFSEQNMPGLMHLDYACGPGHVIDWLKPFGFTQVGLDVSLVNLRNARKNTGCLVVCGDACNMPFTDQAFNLVTESSGLHHILDWQSVVAESCRICQAPGGIIIDSEPSDMQMAWSKLAILFFNARFPVYKLLSYFSKKKYIFRDTRQAKLNLKAEIHHQPGTGFPLTKLKQIIEGSGLKANIVVSPTVVLDSIASPNWKTIILNLLSARNPWNPDYGPFTAIGTLNKK